MSALQSEPIWNLDSLLDEGRHLSEELCRLEEELRRQLLDADSRGLAATVQARTEILRRGERFIEQKRKLAAGKTIRALIELEPEGAGRSSKRARYELLRKKLSAVKAKQEVNRRLLEGGLQIVPRLCGLLPGGKPTYNCRGEIRNPAGIRPGLDQNC